MDKQKKNQDQYVIDVVYVLRALLKKAWAILLIGILIAAIVFCYYSYFVTPQYSASVLLYVNNSSISIGNTLKGFIIGCLAACALFAVMNVSEDGGSSYGKYKYKYKKDKSEYAK